MKSLFCKIIFIDFLLSNLHTYTVFSQSQSKGLKLKSKMHIPCLIEDPITNLVSDESKAFSGFNDQKLLATSVGIVRFTLLFISVISSSSC